MGKLHQHIRANVVGYAAVFLALTGSAVALPGKGTVQSNDIKPNAVKSKHVKDGQLTAADLRDGAVNDRKLAGDAVDSGAVADGSLTGNDIADAGVSGSDLANGSLTAAHIDGDERFVSGVASGQIQNIGAAGSVFGSPFGVSTASASFDTVATGSPADTFSVSRLDVRLPAPLAAGQSRTFALMRTPTNPLNVECTVSAGQQTCQNLVDVGQTNLTGDLAVRVISSGPGLSAGDDARVGFALTTRAPFTE